MLDVARISKQYPTPRGPLTVLSDVTFSLAAGEAAAVTGPSGSGKSSLLYILGALEPPSSGTVSLGGQNPFELAPSELADFRNAEIGFVFQDHCLLPQCTVIENVLVPTLVARDRPAKAGRHTPAADIEFARSLIEQVGLADRIDHRPGELSGGEKQRVAIARALIRRPRLLLCDEPTGNLDPASAATVSRLLLDLHGGRQNVLIVVTHSARLASEFPIRFEIAETRLRRVASVSPTAEEGTEKTEGTGSHGVTK
jgi:lipoprotein-releasing system ATP-binding protein